MIATHRFQIWSSAARLVVTDPQALPPAVDDLNALLHRVELAASRFRSDSALSRANQGAGQPTRIPWLLVELVSAALVAAEVSDGAVDPTIGGAIRRLGYDRDLSQLDRAAVSAAAALPTRPVAPTWTWRDVELDEANRLLMIPPGAELDLGATAKAFAADLAARTLHHSYGTGVLVELGGDLAVLGTRPGGWPIQVAEQEGTAGQLVNLDEGGLATSTTTIRRWRSGGRQLHHLIDPATGAPTRGPWRTASVHAPTALEANTASTAAIVRGARALDWLRDRRLAARLVGTDGSIQLTAGWPQQEWKQAS
jgi:thiamine biosynthesis lipoprotein